MQFGAGKSNKILLNRKKQHHGEGFQNSIINKKRNAMNFCTLATRNEKLGQISRNKILRNSNKWHRNFQKSFNPQKKLGNLSADLQGKKGRGRGEKKNSLDGLEKKRSGEESWISTVKVQQRKSWT